MKLYFQNSYGEERLIAEVLDADEAMDEIQEFCDERSFTIHYTRCWGDVHSDKGMWYDVGSHTEFFKLKDE